MGVWLRGASWTGVKAGCCPYNANCFSHRPRSRVFGVSGLGSGVWVEESKNPEAYTWSMECFFHIWKPQRCPAIAAPQGFLAIAALVCFLEERLVRGGGSGQSQLSDAVVGAATAVALSSTAATAAETVAGSAHQLGAARRAAAHVACRAPSL